MGMRFIVTHFIFTIFLAAFYLVAGDMSYGPRTQKPHSSSKLMSEVDQASGAKAVIRQIATLLMISALAAVVVVLYVVNLPTLFLWMIKFLILHGIYYCADYLLERLHQFVRFSKIELWKAYLTVLGAVYCFSQATTATKVLASVGLAFVVLDTLGNRTVKQALVLETVAWLLVVAGRLCPPSIATALDLKPDVGTDSIYLLNFTDEMSLSNLASIILCGMLMMVSYREGKKLYTKALWTGAFVGLIVALTIADLIGLLASRPQLSVLYTIPGTVAGFLAGVWVKGLSWTDFSSTADLDTESG